MSYSVALEAKILSLALLLMTLLQRSCCPFEDAASSDHLTSFAIIAPKCTKEAKDYVASAFEIELKSSMASHIFFVTVNSETHETEFLKWTWNLATAQPQSCRLRQFLVYPW